jgi:hypothetical protein
MVIASLIGFQVCIVLAPLVIPFWVFSGQNRIFSWFWKTSVGACVLPIAVGTGWGIFLVMVHQFSIYRNLSVVAIFAGWVMQLIFICAGVWFMSRFIKETTAEVFSGHLLSTLFFAGQVLGGGTRLAGAMIPDKMKFQAAQRVMGWNKSGWMPSGLVNSSRNYMSTERAFAEQSIQDAAASGPHRSTSLGWIASRPWGKKRINESAGQVLKNATAALRTGDTDTAQYWLAMLSKPREQEFVNFLWRKLAPHERQAVGRFLAATDLGIGDQGPALRTDPLGRPLDPKLQPRETQMREWYQLGRDLMEIYRDESLPHGAEAAKLKRVAEKHTPGKTIPTQDLRAERLDPALFDVFAVGPHANEYNIDLWPHLPRQRARRAGTT